MKTKFIYIFFISLSIVISSCSLDDVSVEGQGEILEENLVVDQKSANAVLNRAYTGLRIYEMVKFNSALMVAGTEQLISDDQLGVSGFDANNVQSKITTVSDDIYSKLYYVINTCNYLVTQLDAGKAKGIDETRKNEILGEAKTLRAFSRFMLLRAFGQFYNVGSEYGIVISNKPVVSEDKLARNTVKESYDAIIEDLTFAVNNSPDVKDHFYVTKTTAKAFLARVYLYQEEYGKAETLSKEIIDENNYPLEDSYSGIYTKRWTSTEVLFAPYVDDYSEKYQGTEVYNDVVFEPTDYFKTLADNQVSAVPGDGFMYSSGYDPRFIFSYQRGEYGDPNYQNPKYNFDSYNEGNTIYYMRTAEVYLIYAEAAARNGNLSEAVTAINVIRNRANTGISTTSIEEVASIDKAEILEFVRQEKMLELFLETGETWFDIVRYIDNGNLTFSVKETLLNKDQLIFPIPLKAMSGNSKLVQNPSYD